MGHDCPSLYRHASRLGGRCCTRHSPDRRPGVNLGFRNGIALAELIIAAALNGSDAGSTVLLEQYQRLRQADNLMMFAMTDGLDRLFSTDRRIDGSGATSASTRSIVWAR